MEIMAEMERFIVAGYSTSQICQWLGIPRKSFFRYYKRLFEEDCQILQQKRERDLVTAFAILKGRLESLYRESYKIIDSDTATNADKLNAMSFAGNAAVLLIRVEREAPISLFLGNTPPEERANLVVREGQDGQMVALTTEEVRQQEMLAEAAANEAREKYRQKRTPLFLPPRRLDSDEIEQKAKEIEQIRKKLPPGALLPNDDEEEEEEDKEEE
jgi:hypothetical protein